MSRTVPHAAPTGPGAILSLIRNDEATTRAQLMSVTGLSRSTVAQRLDALLRGGYISEVASEESTGGRPAGVFQLNRTSGVLLVAVIGARQLRTAITDLACGVLATKSARHDVGEGPDPVLSTVREHFAELLDELGRAANEVRGIGMGVPGPVEFAAGRVVSPPIMTGWDGYPIGRFFADDFSCPVVVDNEVNCMALGEHRANWSDVPHLLMVKASTGIGSGLVFDGRVHRGAQGSAGDLGHIPARLAASDADDPPLCRCGNHGCVEAYAGGWALVRDLRARGHDVDTAAEVAALARAGDVEAVHLVRTTGRILGQAVADAVSLVNPSVVLVGGSLVEAEEHLLASIRQVVYQQSTPLATRDLRILRSPLAEHAGVVGTASMAADELFAPDKVDHALLA